MNFLAHFYLSGDSKEILTGNFLGDFVKGRHFALDYPEQISKGITLHRSIDHFTDTHPIVRNRTRQLIQKHGRYGGVLLDIFYDYCLAKSWKDYSDISLVTFSQNSYQTLANYEGLFPEKAKLTYKHMSEHDWLSNYVHLEGIERVLNGMERRTKFTSNLSKGIVELKENYAIYEEEFKLFFPQIILHCKNEINKT